MPQHWQACSFILSLIALGVGITSRMGLHEEEASYFFYGSALNILTTALCFVLIYGCICIGRIESRLLSEEGTAPKCLVESASSMWKKHCASHECEECQEGGMNRPIIRDVKPRP